MQYNTMLVHDVMCPLDPGGCQVHQITIVVISSLQHVVKMNSMSQNRFLI